MSANEIAMCMDIARIYAEINLSKSNVQELLMEAGVAVLSGTGLAIVATKMDMVRFNELLSFVPFIGWGIKASLAGSPTAGVGWYS